MVLRKIYAVLVNKGAHRNSITLIPTRYYSLLMGMLVRRVVGSFDFPTGGEGGPLVS